MTTDTQLAPTDPEIAALRSEFGITSNGRGIKEFTQVRDFARAVLDKWGRPAAVVGEPVACGNCGGTGWMVRDPDIGTDQECFVCDGSGGYSESTTPQPTQAQAGAVPLTDEQWQRIADLTDSILTRATKDEIERVIGIKGGQHG